VRPCGGTVPAAGTGPWGRAAPGYRRTGVGSLPNVLGSAPLRSSAGSRGGTFGCMTRELDDVMRQVLAVVQELELPCDDRDVSEVVQDVDGARIRRALQDLGEDYLAVVPREQDGAPARVEVTAVRKRID
jgi:hypothetical protein